VEKMSTRGSTRGFTLIELAIVLVVVAITLSLGTPLLQTLLQSNRLSSERNRFLDAINLARSEAIMRNVAVSICPSTMVLNGIPECRGAYTSGWIVFANGNEDNVVDPESDEVLQVFEGLPADYSLSNRLGTIAASERIDYLPDGSSHRNRTLLFCASKQVSLQPLSIVINIVGRARLAKGWGVCPTT
jgi:type IV fimbrial biogenesis protein FimT